MKYLHNVIFFCFLVLYFMHYWKFYFFFGLIISCEVKLFIFSLHCQMFRIVTLLFSLWWPAYNPFLKMWIHQNYFANVLNAFFWWLDATLIFSAPILGWVSFSHLFPFHRSFIVVWFYEEVGHQIVKKFLTFGIQSVMFWRKGVYWCSNITTVVMMTMVIIFYKK